MRCVMSLRHRGQVCSRSQQVWQQHTWPQGRNTVWVWGKRQRRGHGERCCPVTLIPALLYSSTGGTGAGGDGDHPGVSQRGRQSRAPPSPSPGTAQRCVCTRVRTVQGRRAMALREGHGSGLNPAAPRTPPRAALRTDQHSSSASSFPHGALRCPACLPAAMPPELEG